MDLAVDGGAGDAEQLGQLSLSVLAGVAQALEAGYHTVGDIVDYQDSYRLAYIRGPEGLIVEVAEPLPSASTSA